MQRKILLILLLIGFQLFVAAEAKRTTNTPYQEYLYQQKVLRKIEKEKYKEGLLPFSGYQTVEDYEKQSKDIPNSNIKVPDPKIAKDLKMQYVPQPTYKLTRYNNPPGTAELSILRKFYFNRQENGEGITSPDRSFMVYPAIYYYASSQCTACDLFVIPLDKTRPDVDRILHANVVKRNPTPILSTPKEIREDNIFRTLTPVDFSTDGKKLVIKEKIGYTFDGIWKTNLWVYDFEAKKARKLPEIREAISFYWANVKKEDLDEKRWDIFPLGFDQENPDRIIAAAYGYTGKTPKFLGTWSIDCNGDRTMLVSLFNQTPKISINGYKLVKTGVVDPKIVVAEGKMAEKSIKKNKKAVKKAKIQKKKEAKKALNKKIHEMKAEEAVMKKQYSKDKKNIVPTSEQN